MVARRIPAQQAAPGAVLIIADDPAAREVYAELFVMRGYEVVTATGAREGLKRARNRSIAVAVLAMATGATQLRRKLRALRPKLRIHLAGPWPAAYDMLLTPARQQLH